ncbi:MAG: hypothetical protein M2R45_01517 [Verrucomicrobia subdivision 3 bacterium]|nr:hypothetical protein [Limisphaerales bacterium]MCS1413355.1 hypothetical protein [Limisphaerales bacterium]
MARQLTQKIAWWQVLLILAVPLVFLFHPSLRSELVLFSNDGPLGIISSEAGALPGAFAGYWDDLNWVGRENPSALPDFSMLLGLLVNSSVVYSKIYAPVSLLFLGFAGWLLFRQLGFCPVVCVLGAIAFAFNMNAFSNACWGLPSRATTLASILAALAALHLKAERMPFLRYVLAGFAVGHGIMEGFDVGALYSLVVGGYVGLLILLEKGDLGQKGLKAVGMIAVVAVSAAFFSAQALTTLIGTQVQGVAGMSQDPKDKEQRWNEATQWSLPVKEILRVGIPGMFGYRMTDLGGGLQESSYWGAVGRSPGWEVHKQGWARHSGSGEYAGTLVLLLAAFAVFQSFRGSQGPLGGDQRMVVWFWMGVACVSVVLAFGKYGPLYRLVYELPYFSMIRNPIKFMHLFHLAVLILFGYGMQVLWCHYLARAPERKETLGVFLKQWWASVEGFDRKWTFGSGIVVLVGVLSWLVYASSKNEMIRFLSSVAIPGDIAAAIHAFSVSEVMWSVVFLLGAFLILALIVSGAFNLRQGKALGVIVGLVLLVDLARADRFWIVYYDYKEKYATNPIIEKLRENSFERRVTSTLNPLRPSSLSNENGAFFGIIAYSWLQHQFPFYDIQSLDVVQMPRWHIMDLTFGSLFVPSNVQEGVKYSRLWELTSTRYLLGMTSYVAVLNQQFDYNRDRFKILSQFNFVPKEEMSSSAVKVDDLTVVEHPEGSFGIIEFEGALPKAKRYSNWITLTNEQAVLAQLSDLQFDPAQTVVVMDGSVTPPAVAPDSDGGTATIESYHPKVIRIKTGGSSDGVLLLNDRFHPHWNVYVDGAQQMLLRCNYIMRGVKVPAGDHVVEFRYEPPQLGLGISLTSIGLGCLICIYLVRGGAGRKETNSETSTVPGS